MTDVRILEEKVKSKSKVKDFANGYSLPKHMAEHIYMFAGESIRAKFKAKNYIIDQLIDWENKTQEVTNMIYMSDERAKEDKVFDDPCLMKTPVVRNGKQATVGFCPEIWATWE